MNKKGLFISIEGVDGAGKSTHVNFIRDYLEQNGLTVILTREPGGTKLGEKIRDLLLHNLEPIHRISELLLMFASRQQLIEEIIVPNLAKGFCVLADRFVDASIAYQGGGRGLGSAKVKQIINLLEPQLKTDLTLLFDVPLKVAAKRVASVKHRDRIEQEEESFFIRVQDTYHQIVKEEPGRVKLISTAGSIEDTQAEIIKYLSNLLKYHVE